MSEVLIHEVKLLDGIIGVTYELLSADIKANSFVRGELSPSFREALNALLDYVIDICFLERKRWSEAEVTGVVFKRLDGDDRDVEYKITAKNHASQTLSPIVITTPYLEAFVISEGLQEKLDLVQAEAQAFVAQKREERKRNPHQLKGCSASEIRQRIGTDTRG
jgi:hypothetical protein